MMDVAAKPRKTSVSSVQYVGTDGSNVYDAFNLKGDVTFSNPPWISKAKEASQGLYILGLGRDKYKDICLDGEFIVSTHLDFSELIQAIEEAKYILSLEDDWDEDGAVTYEKEVWVAAVKFLVKYVNSNWEVFGKKTYVPSIYPGPEGSIDISWKQDVFNVLINIALRGSNYVVTYYGDGSEGQEIKGFFNLSNFNTNLFPALMY